MSISVARTKRRGRQWSPFRNCLGRWYYWLCCDSRRGTCSWEWCNPYDRTHWFRGCRCIKVVKGRLHPRTTASRVGPGPSRRHSPILFWLRWAHRGHFLALVGVCHICKCACSLIVPVFYILEKGYLPLWVIDFSCNGTYYISMFWIRLLDGDRVSIDSLLYCETNLFVLPPFEIQNFSVRQLWEKGKIVYAGL